MKTFRRPLFWFIVGIPNLISILYFCLIASAVYVSTASLVVFKPAQGSQNLVSLISGAGGGSSSEGAYILKDYIGSWDEFRNVSATLDLAKQYGHGDAVSCYGCLATLFRTNDVALWHYYRAKVNASIDQNSGIVSLAVYGYSPSAAASVAQQVLRDSVRHIDDMNHQQEGDYIRNAVARRDEVAAKLKSDEAALAAYRVRTGVHDPATLYQSDLALLNTLTEQKAKLEAQYEAIQKATPGNPVTGNLRTAISTIQVRMASAESGVKNLSREAGHYEELSVARDNDIALLKDVDTAVQQARLNAMKNKYYLNIISAPSIPIAPELPRRLEWIAGVFVVTLILWGLLR